jgi:hypothetical protein
MEYSMKLKYRKFIYFFFFFLILVLIFYRTGFMNPTKIRVNNIEIEKPLYYSLDMGHVNYKPIDLSCGLSIGCQKSIKLKNDSWEVATIQFKNIFNDVISVDIRSFSDKAASTVKKDFENFDGKLDHCLYTISDCSDRLQTDCVKYDVLRLDDNYIISIISTDRVIGEKMKKALCQNDKK